jgi:hypothetical protein
VAVPIEWLVGPAAGLALALVVARELWRAHQAEDARERKRADAMEERLTALVDVLRKAAPK